MDDKEILDLVEHYKWAISPQTGGGWVIDGAEPTGGGDSDIIELARTRGTIRDAVKMAMRNQAAGKVLAVK